MKNLSIFAITLFFLLPNYGYSQDADESSPGIDVSIDIDSSVGTLGKVKEFFTLPSFGKSESDNDMKPGVKDIDSDSVVVITMERNIDVVPDIIDSVAQSTPSPQVSLPSPGQPVSTGIRLNTFTGNAMEIRPEEKTKDISKVAPSFHPESLSLINSSLLNKCATDFNTNVAMINSILNDNEKKAVRDMRRSLNECLNTHLEKDTLNYLASVAAVSLKYSVCPQECSKEDYEKIAQTVFGAQENMIEIISHRLVDSLKSNCSDDLSSVCVVNATENLDTKITLSDLDWAKLNDQYRVYDVLDPEVDIITDNLKVFKNEIRLLKMAVEKEFKNPISGLNIPVDKEIGNDIREQLDNSVRVFADGSLKLSIFDKPARIFGQNMFIKISTDITTKQCKEIIRNARELGVRQMFMNEQNVAIALEPNIYYCSADNKNRLTLVY